jgi:hypothetical protein
VQAIQPPRTSSENESGRSRVGNDAGGKRKASFLRRRVDVAQQTATAEMGSPSGGIDPNTPHPRQVDHQATFARAEPGQAMSSAANGGYYAGGGSGTYGRSNVFLIAAQGDQSRLAGKHSVPNARGIPVSVVASSQKTSLEAPLQCPVKIADGVVHVDWWNQWGVCFGDPVRSREFSASASNAFAGRELPGA